MKENIALTLLLAHTMVN